MTEQSLKATVQSDLTDAIRQRDQVRSGTLRLALTAITNEEVSGTEARELSDDEVLKVLAKEAKKRKEAATAYTGAGRPELAAKEEAELVVLEAYLPAQLSDDELATIVAAAIEQTGATGMPQLGQVMKVAQAVVAGRADGGRVGRRREGGAAAGLTARGPALPRITRIPTKGPSPVVRGPSSVSLGRVAGLVLVGFGSGSWSGPAWAAG